MIRNTLLGVYLAAVTILARPAYAADGYLSDIAKAMAAQAVDASFRAASACYSVQYLVFSSIEAKGRGASKEAVFAAAASRTQMRPELNSAIELAFEVKRVTDPAVDAFFASCLERTRVEIQEAIFR